MKLGRIAVDGPDGPVARLVIAQPEQQQVVDLLTAERIRLQLHRIGQPEPHGRTPEPRPGLTSNETAREVG